MPNWKGTIFVGEYFHNAALTFAQCRDGIAAALTRSSWYANNPDVADLVDELGEMANTADFDSLWSDLYDLADRDRVWITTTHRTVTAAHDRGNP